MFKATVAGVIPARFEVDELTDGHRALISHVWARHTAPHILIALGVHSLKAPRTKKYPLTFGEREMMLRQAYLGRDFVIKPLCDHPISHEMWSQWLDALVKETFGDMPAVLYCGRDGFAEKYTGLYPIEVVPEISTRSGTERRKSIEMPHTPDARRALIWDQMHRHDFMYSTSDLAIRDPKTGRVLLTGKNEHGGLLAFMGGHAEKTDGNGRTTASRERSEEIKDIITGSPIYIGTEVIDDPRYRDTGDGVMTSFFWTDYLGGDPTPSDDIHHVEWVNPSDFPKVLVPWHRKLGELYRERLCS